MIWRGNRPFLLFALFASVASVLMVIPPGPEGQGIHEGDLAPRDLAASRGAQFESQVLTDAARDREAASVEDVYNTEPDTAIVNQQVAKARDLLDAFRPLVQRTDLRPADRVNEAQGIPGSQVLSTTAQITIFSLDRAGFEDFRTRAINAVTSVMGAPILPSNAADRITDYLNRNPPSDTIQGPMREILRAFVIQNVQVDRAATDEARAAARDSVAPIVLTYSAGQLIAEEGKRLNAADIELLRQTGVLSAAFDGWRTLGGAGMGIAFGCTLAWFLFRRRDHAILDERVALVSGVFTIALLVAVRLVLPGLLPDRDEEFYAYALPLPAAAIVAALLCGRTAGLVVATLTGLFAAFIAATYPDLAGSGFSGSLAGLELVTAYILGGFAGAWVASVSRRVWATAAAGVAATAAVGGVLLVFWTMGEPRLNDRLSWIGSVAGISGLSSAVLGAIAAGIAAWAFGIASPASLARLGQTGQPLLRRLQSEAPGTYQHSLTVATLAEAAAERIRANGLLARVGALYHDIGKLGTPAVYIENSLEGQPSPHESLAPEVSAAAIRAHVSRGLEIARTYRLPPAVRAFIPEHHGTRLVMYFYGKAIATGEPVDRETFRYGGPKPQSRETAIVMLADSCEAVVRADEDHSTAQIARLVDGIVAERISEGELDECGISLNDLRAVAASFKETLRAVYHPRVAYPVLSPDELARVAAD